MNAFLAPGEAETPCSLMVVWQELYFARIVAIYRRISFVSTA